MEIENEQQLPPEPAAAAVEPGHTVSEGLESPAKEDPLSLDTANDEAPPVAAEIEEILETETGGDRADEEQKEQSDRQETVNRTTEEAESIKPKPDPTVVELLLLEGETLSFEKKEQKQKAEIIIDKAHSDSQVHENDFFSVYFYDDCERECVNYKTKLKQKIFLDPNKQLKGQVFIKKREPPQKLQYGVKFYVPDPAKLKEDYSRYLYCLQLCDDIRNNLVRVDRETAIRLTALMLQGRVYDYDEENHKPGYTSEYSRFTLLPKSLQPENYEAQIIEVHKAKTGYTPATCDQEFLDIVKDLPRYGQHQFLAKDVENRVVTVGNGCLGISLYFDPHDTELNANLKDLRIEWKDIVKISYKRRKFKIKYFLKIESDNESEDSRREIRIIKLYTGNPPQAKRIWKNAVEQHTFFRLNEPEVPSLINTIFRRGTSFRYSGRTYKQTLKDRKHKSVHEVPPKNVKAFVIQENLDEQEGFYVMPQPLGASEDIDPNKIEYQQVVVDFHHADKLPDDTRHYVIQRDKSGSVELLSTGLIDDEKDNERTYYLSEVDQNSKTATVSVSLNIDSPTGIDVTVNSDKTTTTTTTSKGVTIFDSERLPVVKLGSASVVTTATTVESAGKKLTYGEHSQRYPLEEVADVHMVNGELEQWAGPHVDGLEEAKQVNLFLDKEHSIIQKAFDNLAIDSDINQAPPTASELPTPVQ